MTPREAGESLAFLPAQLLNQAELMATGGRIVETGKLIRFLRGKDAVVLDLEPITREVLRRCPDLKVIARFGEGCDTIDLESAKSLGVRVANTKGVSSLAVARHALSFILALTHRITENNANLKKGLWNRQANLSESNTTLGILGFGKIGRIVADLARPLGFNILVYDCCQIKSRYKYAGSLNGLIESSDIISIHLPLTSKTKNIISGKIIRKLKEKYLVNTARGGLVNEEELIKALGRGWIAGYATDVFLHEPISGVSRRLAKHPRVICSPHVAALDRITNIKVAERALENALYSLNNKHGKVISYVV